MRVGPYMFHMMNYYLSEPRREFVDSKGKLLPGSLLLTIPRR